jgi:O-acetyl-ADP-ribose deacetylase (regulator of RNase III)
MLEQGFVCLFRFCFCCFKTPNERPELRAACKGLFCATGDAVLTPGFKLKQKFVIHTVAPYLDEKGNEQPLLLKRCYTSCLEQALKKKNLINSIAFPCLGTGYYGYPLKEASIIAITAVSEFLQQHKVVSFKVA